MLHRVLDPTYEGCEYFHDYELEVDGIFYDVNDEDEDFHVGAMFEYRPVGCSDFCVCLCDADVWYAQAGSWVAIMTHQTSPELEEWVSTGRWPRKGGVPRDFNLLTR